MADKNEVRVGGIWFCKIGEHSPLQRGADSPMRDAVAAEYKKLTGQEPAFIFSGWGGELTEGERAVVENRLPPTPPADAALADDALCESLIEASDMRWNGDVYVGDGSDLMSLVRAGLRARAVPDGFVMVPVEPTDEMLVAGFRAWGENVHGVWTAMLAASKWGGK